MTILEDNLHLFAGIMAQAENMCRDLGTSARKSKGAQARYTNISDTARAELLDDDMGRISTLEISKVLRIAERIETSIFSLKIDIDTGNYLKVSDNTIVIRVDTI